MLLFAIAVLLLPGPLSPLRAEEPKAENPRPDEKAQWKTLFDGKSLDGWKPADFFKPASSTSRTAPSSWNAGGP
jgi:hypothetical protein